MSRKRTQHKDVRTVRKTSKAEMIRKLQDGKKYGDDCWQITKSEINNIKHSSRYRKMYSIWCGGCNHPVKHKNTDEGLLCINCGKINEME